MLGAATPPTISKGQPVRTADPGSHFCVASDPLGDPVAGHVPFPPSPGGGLVVLEDVAGVQERLDALRADLRRLADP